MKVLYAPTGLAHAYDAERSDAYGCAVSLCGNFASHRWTVVPIEGVPECASCRRVLRAERDRARVSR